MTTMAAAFSCEIPFEHERVRGDATIDESVLFFACAVIWFARNARRRGYGR